MTNLIYLNAIGFLDRFRSNIFLGYEYSQRTFSLSFTINFLKLNPAAAIIKLILSPICPLRKFIAAR